MKQNDSHPVLSDAKILRDAVVGGVINGLINGAIQELIALVGFCAWTSCYRSRLQGIGSIR